MPVLWETITQQDEAIRQSGTHNPATMYIVSHRLTCTNPTTSRIHSNRMHPREFKPSLHTPRILRNLNSTMSAPPNGYPIVKIDPQQKTVENFRVWSTGETQALRFVLTMVRSLQPLVHAIPTAANQTKGNAVTFHSPINPTSTASKTLVEFQAPQKQQHRIAVEHYKSGLTSLSFQIPHQYQHLHNRII